MLGVEGRSLGLSRQGLKEGGRWLVSYTLRQLSRASKPDDAGSIELGRPQLMWQNQIRRPREEQFCRPLLAAGFV